MSLLFCGYLCSHSQCKQILDHVTDTHIKSEFCSKRCVKKYLARLEGAMRDFHDEVRASERAQPCWALLSTAEHC